ncbi:RNA-dependent RNA polymerase [Mycena indigotica]|uniref:RNA-dependent RNA polymerase n=1 Tax=Mycena indigotica TaxID=2126181 RepID=A0A8H6SBY1_9AGAR|nr:RNA-dependent RNA polymerase [Mycena indigotica]KAF7295512.1 RNA-dependent RNA polymerase [Mycena indigotica]
MAKVLLRNVPTTADNYDITLALASVLHSDDFRTFARLTDDEEVGHDEETRIPGSLNRKLLNFSVKLDESTIGITRNKGTGKSSHGMLSLPSEHVREKLLRWLTDFDHSIRLGKHKLKLLRGHGSLGNEMTILSKTPYVDPNIEREHQRKLDELEEQIRVDVVQFGCYYRQYPSRPLKDGEPIPPREYSIEWQREYFNTTPSKRRPGDSPGPPSGVAWLKFEYDHKRILGDETTEYQGALVIVTFARHHLQACSRIRPKTLFAYSLQSFSDLILPIASDICFDTLTPPILEGIQFHRTLTGNHSFDSRRSKVRIGSLEPGHLRVAPYAHQIRLLLYNDYNRDMIQVFTNLCFAAGFTRNMVFRMPPHAPLEALQRNFFTSKRLYKLESEFRRRDWPIVFQLEALLRNGLLQSDDIENLLPKIDALSAPKGSMSSAAVGYFLQEFIKHLGIKSLRESPSLCFARVLTALPAYNPLALQSGAFNCCHVTVTPTRMIFTGPFPVQSNRIIRQFQGYENHFIRVDFRDEDKLQYRWARDVDGSHFVRERVGNILKHGLCIGGRMFEFLAYSTSALRGHAVWFMSPFKGATGTDVTSQSIRDSIGNFAGTPLLKAPSKFAARLAQAFTATDPSVKIGPHEWEEMPDIVNPGWENANNPPGRHVHTDGVGTISLKLAERIWIALCTARNWSLADRLTPSAFQIRFLGYKGVVRVDPQLDKRTDGIQMRLRPSMRKFESDKEQKENAEIEIAMAFEKPSTAYLNRPLVMALEDRNVRQEAFIKLQNLAVADARTIDDGIAQFRKILRDHSLGGPYRLVFILDRLEKLGLDLKSKTANARHRQSVVRRTASESYLLVGVADEGPAYKREGLENVYVLPPGKIYACIQRPEDEKPTWLTGSCTISRSPIAHLGDIQRVTAIGEPPAGMLCSFEGLKNVVVLPSTDEGSKAPRSLASCLGGGDLDVGVIARVRFTKNVLTLSSDLYSVIPYSPLLPSGQVAPASYPDGETFKLERDSTVDDICDFIIEYINSDVLGLLSDRLLIIADQSKEGMHDSDCVKLAALCSQAVDYPKQGIPVDLDANPLPKLLIRCKPDWHAAEVVKPREEDYYTSDKALGSLYRAIKLNSIETELPSPAAQNGQAKHNIISDPIHFALLHEIERVLNWTPPVAQPSSTDMKNTFTKYVADLRYISLTHTLTTEAGQALLESEIVIGTILAKSVQKRWRADCIYRCRYHASAVVRDVQQKLWHKQQEPASQTNLRGLERAWSAFEFSIREQHQFGAKSFGLIALGTIFEWLDSIVK